jgi:hypothetical protein
MISSMKPKSNSSESFDTFMKVAWCAALPTIVAMRRKAGIRVLSSGALICVSFVMYLIDTAYGRGPGLLTLGAIALVSYGFYERHARFAELEKGAEL